MAQRVDEESRWVAGLTLDAPRESYTAGGLSFGDAALERSGRGAEPAVLATMGTLRLRLAPAVAAHVADASGAGDTEVEFSLSAARWSVEAWRTAAEGGGLGDLVIAHGIFSRPGLLLGSEALTVESHPSVLRALWALRKSLRAVVDRDPRVAASALCSQCRALGREKPGRARDPLGERCLHTGFFTEALERLCVENPVLAFECAGLIVSAGERFVLAKGAMLAMIEARLSKRESAPCTGRRLLLNRSARSDGDGDGDSAGAWRFAAAAWGVKTAEIHGFSDREVTLSVEDPEVDVSPVRVFTPRTMRPTER